MTPDAVDPQRADDSLYQHTAAGQRAADEPVTIPAKAPDTDTDTDTEETGGDEAPGT